MNNKTRWVVKINDLKNKRVLIEYLPLENKFIFSGQFKILEIWYNFSKKEIVLGNLITGMDENENYIYNDINVNNIDIDDNIILVYIIICIKIIHFNN